MVSLNHNTKLRRTTSTNNPTTTEVNKTIRALSARKVNSNNTSKSRLSRSRVNRVSNNSTKRRRASNTNSTLPARTTLALAVSVDRSCLVSPNSRNSNKAMPSVLLNE
jgi:hypothetical protein